MYTAVIPIRKLLQAAEAATFGRTNTLFMIQNDSTTAVAEPLHPSPSQDSAMTLTILIVLTAFVLIGCFSVYSRCFSHRSNNSPLTPSNQKIGLDASALKSLPLLPYDAAATPPLLEDCPICLGEFGNTESVKMIPNCGHVFHPGCIDAWLESHVSCPLCRSTQLLRVAEEV
ncbi:RING-H2 finger protein ATL57-like [Primulina huaijiensis]|uniref:RING-H2 finger protein ATL57-like n=1 Tax=Primulina huaijiensis TaxID=1492673 RepID=UPI003CC73BC3